MIAGACGRVSAGWIRRWRDEGGRSNFNFFFFFFLMIRRQPRSKQSRSSAASIVYKRQVMVCLLSSFV